MALNAGARQLPPHHITIRVPWHDGGWTGRVCDRPLDNTSCLILPRIGEGRRDQDETRCAGQRLDEIGRKNLPPCVGEKVSFMAPFELTRTIAHPYRDIFPETHGHLASTRFAQPAYSAACVPYRWTLREKVEGDPRAGETGLAERLQIGWIPEREPDIRNRHGKRVATAWVQEGENQLALLNTFFSALRPHESLCFFYAKRTPLSDQSRRVIVGVGRVLSVSEPTEYGSNVANPPLRAMLWERNIGHSVRPGFADGFLFPYREAMALAEQDGVSPEEFVAFAPDEHFDAYSYGSELLPHDGAVASLITCAATLHRIRDRIEGPWDEVLAWIDTQLNRLWKARGAYPGLGSALSAFGYEWGFQHGTLLAYEIELMAEREGEIDPWALVDAVMADPSKLHGSMARLLAPSLRRGWQRLTAERRALLQLLARCALSENQALRLYDATERNKTGIELTDADLIANPYLLFEDDRRAIDPIAFRTVDRGVHPADDTTRTIDDPADQRRVRALAIDLLDEAAGEGHTLLPRSWLISRARERALQPPCPLGENVLDATEEFFGSAIERSTTRTGEPAYQLDRLVECRNIIRKEVLGRKRGRPHEAVYDWRSIVNEELNKRLPKDPDERELEVRARTEKAEALEQMFRSRLSVLIGSAGTGKTTLLKMLCSLLPEQDMLLLAPTGKARVRLEEQTDRRGSGQTLAQFLIGLHRYNGDTGAYFPSRKAPRCADYRTVIVDECSMLTEEQLAALIDALRNVERLVLVGDPCQLPPIGAGRPFSDIVRELEPPELERAERTNANTFVPRCAPGYAELTITRRQQGSSRADMLLASHFNGKPIDPGADAVLDGPAGSSDSLLRLVQWNHPDELHEKLVAELVRGLPLSGTDDEVGFEESLGGNRYMEASHAFFRNKYRDHPGAAAKVEAWQILSPVRAGMVGVEALNRMIQTRFRTEVRARAEQERWARKVPQPVGPQAILYGDKVINVVNQRRTDVWPSPDGEAYIANGDIGIVVGQYKDRGAKYKGLPWKIEVEFAGQLGHKYGFSKREFGDDGANPLELAYCLTVHKTQGSEFDRTFIVLTNPCWLLSRELLYTALTRHVGRLTVLHQGPLAAYRGFATDEHSEIARRMTNLFGDPRPREVAAGNRVRFLEDGLIHRTESGDLVRSKSEVIIADKLFARGVDYAYEQPLTLPNGRTRYPDFTIVDPARGMTFYWEHLGLLDDPEYQSRWERKRAEYLEPETGIKHWQEPGDSAHILVETRDRPGGGIDSTEIARLIDEVVAA